MTTKNKGVSVYLPSEVEEYLTRYCQEYGIVRKNKDGEEKPALGTAIVELLKIFASLPSDIEEYLSRYCKEYGIVLKDREGKDNPDLGSGLTTILKLFINNNSNNLPSPLPNNVLSEDIAVWQQHQEKKISKLGDRIEQLNNLLSSQSDLSSTVSSNVIERDEQLKQITEANDRLLKRVTHLEAKSNLPSNVVTRNELTDIIDSAIKAKLPQLETQLTEKISSAIAQLENKSSQLDKIINSQIDNKLTELDKKYSHKIEQLKILSQSAPDRSMTERPPSENNNPVLKVKTENNQPDEGQDISAVELEQPETNEDISETETQISKKENQISSTKNNSFNFDNFANKYGLTIEQKKKIKNGATDKELAEITGANYHSIRRLRIGETTNPKTEKAKDIQEYLKPKNNKWYPKDNLIS